jgi:pimeloyl-ACP methyl ester carboxylesterase
MTGARGGCDRRLGELAVGPEARIRWLEWGPAWAAEVVIALHGFGQTADFLEPLASALIERGDVRVLAPHLRGHGESSDVTADCIDDCFVSDAAALARSVGRACVWFGNSLGARVAALTAAEHPDLVSRLVLAESFLGVQRHSRLSRLLLAGARDRLRRHPSFASRDEAREFAREAFHLPDRSVEAWLEHSLRTLPDGGLALKIQSSILDHTRWASDEAVAAALSRIRARVLLVFGGSASALSAAQQGMVAASFAKPRVERIMGAGHDVFLDAPEPLADLILERQGK